MDRRSFLESGALAAVALPSLQVPVDAGVGAVARTLTNTVLEEFYDPGIEDIRYPLAMVPAIHEPGETLRVEVTDGLDPPASVTLVPHQGGVTDPVHLERTAAGSEDSICWPSESVAVGEYTVPDRGLTPGAYTLEVETDGSRNRQHGAVHLTESFPDEPKILVLSDPHAGDGKDGWPGFQQAVEEINLLDPDLVLTAGDYINGQPSVLIRHDEDDPLRNPDPPSPSDYPALYEATYEWYEDAHRILNGLSVPAFVTVGNHDGYIQRTIDGLEVYERYFGPRHYSIEIRPGLKLASFNTYDWAATDRKGMDFLVSAWGGQVRDDQLEWFREDLTGWREENPDGAILALGHHNPTATADQTGLLTEGTRGIPILEHFARGVDTLFLQEGQYWFGDNRLAVRDLLADVDVTLFACGHTHRDRLARLHDGHVVRTETSGGVTFEEGRLQYVTRDNEVDDSWSQEDLREILTDPDGGPLFVETTTAESATRQYEGWRHLGRVPLDGLDPSGTGYPADDAFLDEAVGTDRPGFPAEHAELGLYSHPRGRLDVDVTEADEGVILTVTNDLATAVSGAVVVTIPSCPDPSATGGSLEWHRRGEDIDDVKVRFDVAAESRQEVVLECP